MINIIINEKLKSFEADIRELVLAFYPWEKVVYNQDIECDVLIDNYFNGTFSGNRYEDKNLLKQSLYAYLKEKTGKSLPYGTLTGIRPVSIATKELETKTKARAKKTLQQVYLTNDEKTDLLFEIATKEQSLLKKIEYKNGYSIYIGIPFCPSTCLYCSFTSYNYDEHKNEVEKYLDTLDYEFSKFQFPEEQKLLSVYVGGGTPTSLSVEELMKLMLIIHKHINIKQVPEFCVEAGRPDSIDKYKLRVLKVSGVSRISINPQTFNQKTLNLIGRKHTTEDSIKAFNLAREVGFDNINMDIILGLPNENLDDVIHTLKILGRLKPESISVHLLTIKRASRLNLEKDKWQSAYLAGFDESLQVWDNKSKSPKGITNIEAMEKLAELVCRELKMTPYYMYRQKNMAGNLENIAFAKKGKECLYNIYMMEEKHTVYGFGAGASSKVVRYENNEKIIDRVEKVKCYKDYIERIDELLKKNENPIHKDTYK